MSCHVLRMWHSGQGDLFKAELLTVICGSTVRLGFCLKKYIGGKGRKPLCTLKAAKLLPVFELLNDENYQKGIPSSGLIDWSTCFRLFSLILFRCFCRDYMG